MSEERVAQLTEELQKMRIEQVGTHSSLCLPARLFAGLQRAGPVRAHRKRRWSHWSHGSSLPRRT